MKRSFERRRIIQRPVLSHDQYRLMRHYVVDPRCVEQCRLAIGELWRPFYGIFGDLNAVLRYMPLYTARILKFPERRSELAKLRAEIKELRKTVRGGCC